MSVKCLYFVYMFCKFICFVCFVFLSQNKSYLKSLYNSLVQFTTIILNWYKFSPVYTFAGINFETPEVKIKYCGYKLLQIVGSERFRGDKRLRRVESERFQ